MGVTRIVLGREVSIVEAKKIKEEAEIEVEMFIHGSMCMAYSGNCVISNYTQGRDSNRGGCAHSCRFEYSLNFDNTELEARNKYFMSSKDLNGLRVLEDFIKAGIDSVKIEGRMKSHLYAATMSKVYSEAMDFYRVHGHFLSDKLLEWERELSKVVHRSYSEANLIEKADETTIFNEREFNKDSNYVMVGRILESKENEYSLLEVRNAFNLGDELEVLPFKGDAEKISGEKIERTNPSTIVKLSYIKNTQADNIVRMRQM